MITIQTLKYLISNKLKDTKTLIEKKRYPAAVYIAGYVIEIALKYKICKIFQFEQGFPETRQELSDYLTRMNINGSQPFIISLSDIKTHDLNKLLFYSGLELKIKNHYLNEWSTVIQWSPENRYKKSRVLNTTAEAYLKAVQKIIKRI